MNKLLNILILLILSSPAHGLDTSSYSYTDMYIYDNQDYNTNTDIDPNTPTIKDPFEPINRSIFGLNNMIDILFITPTAELYSAMMPKIGKSYISNFFSNLGEPLNFINLILQGKLPQARITLGRFLTNSSLGCFGIMDVATKFNLNYKGEDFGQTLGYHKVPTGPFIMIPIFGPSSLRDTSGKVADFFMDPFRYKIKRRVYNDMNLVWLLHKRSESSTLINTVRHSLDPYETAKMLYIQNRTIKIND